MKLYQILEECKRQARLCGADYQGYAKGYRQDRYMINRDRKAVLKLCREGFIKDDEEITGRSTNTRLTINETELDYTAGQYAPVEIYDALFTLLAVYRKIRNEKWIIENNQ